jgi:hypothetical protein
MRRGWRVAVRTAAAVAGSAALARLGLPALAVVLLIVVVAAAVVCWIVASAERSGNAAQVIGAARGQDPRLAPAAPEPTAGHEGPRPARRPGRRKNPGEGAGRG